MISVESRESRSLLSTATAGEMLFDFLTLRELVDVQVDVILAGPVTAQALQRSVLPQIPIVMVAAIDPVNNGVVSSLARPQANVTGLTFEVTREQAGKNLELLKEPAPKTSRVALLRTPSNSRHLEYSREAETAANNSKSVSSLQTCERALIRAYRCVEC